MFANKKITIILTILITLACNSLAYSEKFSAKHMVLAKKAMNIMFTEKQVNEILYKKIDSFTEDRNLEPEVAAKVRKKMRKFVKVSSKKVRRKVQKLFARTYTENDLRFVLKYFYPKMTPEKIKAFDATETGKQINEKSRGFLWKLAKIGDEWSKEYIPVIDEWLDKYDY